jgi:hypothetical protein
MKRKRYYKRSYKPKRRMKKPFKGLRAECDRGRPIALYLPTGCTDEEQHYVRIAANGTASMPFHKDAQTIAAFSAFGAEPPGCFRVLSSYEANPFDGFIYIPGIWDLIRGDQELVLCMKFVKHVAWVYDESDEVTPEGKRDLKYAIDIGMNFAKGEIPDSTHFARDVQDAAEALKAYTEGGVIRTKYRKGKAVLPVTEPPYMALFAAVRMAIDGVLHGVSEHAFARIGHEALRAVALTEGVGYKPGWGVDLPPKARAESLWQVQQMMKALDGEKLCP